MKTRSHISLDKDVDELIREIQKLERRSTFSNTIEALIVEAIVARANKKGFGLNLKGLNVK